MSSSAPSLPEGEGYHNPLHVDAASLLAQLGEAAPNPPRQLAHAFNDTPQCTALGDVDASQGGSGPGFAPLRDDEEAFMPEDVSLQRLVIDVKPDIMLQDDDAPTKSTQQQVAGTDGAALSDEPTYECSLHKKNRKERFLMKHDESGEWVCREGSTCKAASSESKKERRRTGQDSAMSVHSNNNASLMSNGGGAKSLLSAHSVGALSTSQQQSMFVCAAHKKVRSARNLALVNGQWVCLAHSQCQLAGDRHQVGEETHRNGQSYHSNNSTSSTIRPPPPAYTAGSMQQQSQQMPFMGGQQMVFLMPQGATNYPAPQPQPAVFHNAAGVMPGQQQQQYVYVMPPAAAANPQQILSHPQQQSFHFVPSPQSSIAGSTTFNNQAQQLQAPQAVPQQPSYFVAQPPAMISPMGQHYSFGAINNGVWLPQ